MKFLDLFSGIGGFSLGLERAGFETVAFCEVNPFCQRVLAHHWPDVRIYDDVRSLSAAALERDGITVDAICGGFPCQDLSHAGKRAGLEGERSGLWTEYARLVGEIRPRYVIVENVPGLLSLGMGRVLGDLAALGYDAVWDCIPAAAVGAPHRRDRVWIIAHAQHPDADQSGSHRVPVNVERDAKLCDKQERVPGSLRKDVADTNRKRKSQPKGIERNFGGWFANESWWSSEPNVGRVAYGVSARVDRLRSLGNAVVPQIPELIGSAILCAEAGL
ncbi:MAG: DNA cytosine methyltransferase [Phenylobacterium sp.]|uniref:DNA cytosine methyltransferase n=1 Tax=Phenylobacterium sp. TaxID=1871053 RepID=UPI002A310906|nr:DNA cytosine methyltransferase [Phenylobacterium sp.]